MSIAAKIIIRENSLAYISPKLFIEWHPNKNGELNPHDITYGSMRLIWWLCNECSHEWEQSSFSRYFKNRISECPKCREVRLQKVKEDSLLEMKIYAESKGGKCLSDSFVNAHLRLEFVCSVGHYFPLKANKIRTEKSWCRKCYYIAMADAKRGSISEMRTIAIERGGLCLSDKYEDARSALLWKCAKGHTWEATPDNIKNKMSWCPDCHTYINEEKCRYILQILTGKSFPKNRKVFNKVYEMDGYNDELMLGFEYHGRQHYEYIKRWHLNQSDLELRKENDEKKEIFCTENGIKLIIIPYYLDSDKDKIELIKNTLMKYDIKLITNDINMGNFRYNDQMLERYAAIAILKGGKCLSTVYESAHTSLEWECGNRHTWPATPTNIQSGKWCDECHKKENGKLRGNLLSLSLRNPGLAAEWHPTKNGLFSTDNYIVSSSEEVWWLGNCGHEWPDTIKSRNAGKKCIYCNFRVITDEKSLAVKYPQLSLEWHYSKNGSLTPYDVTPGMRKKVWWVCSACGHEWEDYIYNRVDVPSRKGRGCRKC